jgi:hypothetical protein
MVVDSDLSNYLDLVESNMHALAFVTSLTSDRQSGQFVTTIFVHPIAFFVISFGLLGYLLYFVQILGFGSHLLIL